jgi:hypothetical protein
MRRMAVLCLGILALGCGADAGPGVVCTAIAKAGLSVGVTNAQTSQPACDAIVTALDGAYREQLLGTSCRYVGAWERPGTYVVRVERAGFVTKEVADVRVAMGSGDCPHVEEVRLEVQVIPAP